MATTNDGGVAVRRPWWGRFRLSFRMWMLVIGAVGVLVGTQYRRESISPRNVASLAAVAKLDKNDIYRIAWSRKRDRMGVIGWQTPVEVRDAVSLRLVETIGDQKKIIHFAFCPKDDIVAYSENDQSRTAKILDRGTGETVTVDAGGDQPDVVFSAGGSLLATGGYAAAVRLWSVPDGQFVRQFDVGPAIGGLTPEFSPDGRVLAVGHRNSTTFLFETATGRLLNVLPKAMSQEIQFHPEGHTLAIAYVDGSIALGASRTARFWASGRPRPRNYTRWTGRPTGSSWRRRATRGRSRCGTPATLRCFVRYRLPSGSYGSSSLPTG